MLSASLGDYSSSCCASRSHSCDYRWQQQGDWQNSTFNRFPSSRAERDLLAAEQELTAFETAMLQRSVAATEPLWEVYGTSTTAQGITLDMLTRPATRPSRATTPPSIASSFWIHHCFTPPKSQSTQAAKSYTPREPCAATTWSQRVHFAMQTGIRALHAPAKNSLRTDAGAGSAALHFGAPCARCWQSMPKLPRLTQSTDTHMYSVWLWHTHVLLAQAWGSCFLRFLSSL